MEYSAIRNVMLSIVLLNYKYKQKAEDINCSDIKMTLSCYRVLRVKKLTQNIFQ